MSDEFDWQSDQDIIVREQPATAIYRNPHGVIVIRQMAGLHDDGDSFVFVSPEFAGRVAIALLDCAGIVTLSPEVMRMVGDRPDIDWGKVIADFDAMSAPPRPNQARVLEAAE